jgi:hypothetical protein
MEGMPDEGEIRRKFEALSAAMDERSAGSGPELKRSSAMEG